MSPCVEGIGKGGGDARVATHVHMRRDRMSAMEENTGAERHSRRRPPRLEMVFQTDSAPPLLCDVLHRRASGAAGARSGSPRFSDTRGRGRCRGVGAGRYVIKPDHVHLFVRGGSGFRLAYWTRGLRRAMSDALRADGVEGPVWQEGYFDHVLRSSESYAEKWQYVRENPIRKELALRPEDWPYAGEIVRIDRA
jgi:hypothetical protein